VVHHWVEFALAAMSAMLSSLMVFDSWTGIVTLARDGS